MTVNVVSMRQMSTQAPFYFTVVCRLAQAQAGAAVYWEARQMSVPGLVVGTHRLRPLYWRQRICLAANQQMQYLASCSMMSSLPVML